MNIMITVRLYIAHFKNSDISKIVITISASFHQLIGNKSM